MASMAEYRPTSGGFIAQPPHRKPLPSHPTPGRSVSSQLPERVSSARPFQSQQHQQPQFQQFQTQQQQQEQSSPPLTHNRTRTSSSTIFPSATATQQPYPNQNSYQSTLNQHNSSDRRTLSIATTSTTLSSSVAGTTLAGTQPSSTAASTLQRTTSSRSGNSPLSYVALMRKQKATVWCDRAQLEDPSLIRQQKLARERALREVASGNAARYSASNSSSSGGFTSKIRHHAPKAQMYLPSSHPASGVPMRLSANEVDEDDVDEDNRTRSMHRRTGSERSSLGSAGRMSSQFGASKRTSGGTPPDGHSYSLNGSTQSPPNADLELEDETPVPDQYKRKDYFSQNGGQGVSAGSSSSGEGRENSFGGLGNMPVKTVTAPAADSKDADDLKRRGSVDDRTMTMSGYGRLFVANPDVD